MQHLRSFFDDFLDVVFAKVSVAGVVELLNQSDGFRLGNRHDPDPLGFGPGSLRRLMHPEHHRPERRHGGALRHQRRSHWVRESEGGLDYGTERKTSGARVVEWGVSSLCWGGWTLNTKQRSQKKKDKKNIEYWILMVRKKIHCTGWIFIFI